MSTSTSSRRHDYDALRVLGCYLLFLFHVGMVFNPAPFFHVRNEDTSFSFFVLCGFIGLWHMPLLFLLAGWAALSSLRQRRVGAFLRERAAKLAVPLLAGCVLLAPIIKYLELCSGQDLNHRGLSVSAEVLARMQAFGPVDLPVAPAFHESFWTFLPTFFTDLDRFSWSHLWFVAYLLAFTIALLPALAWLARRAPVRTLPARAWIYLPILPLAAIQLWLRERFPGPYNLYDDWASVAYYVTFLGAGVALAAAPRLEERLRAERRRLLGLALGATAVLLVAVVAADAPRLVLLVGSAVAGWSWVASLLGFTLGRVCHAGPRLRFGVESAFPVYVLHQPVVVVLGSAIVSLSLGIAAKFALLLGGSVLATLALYAYGVRPFAPTRFLLGMKRRSRSGRSDPPRTVPTAPATARAALHLALPLLLLLPLRPAAAAAGDPTGLWWAEGGFAQIEIRHCGASLCGRVVWLRHPLDEHGCTLRDVENPDPRLRVRPVEGLDILRDLRPSRDASDEWGGGEIYDPSSGRTYSAVLELDGPDRLRVRGYLGIRLLGRTTVWVRVGSERQCRSPA